MTAPEPRAEPDLTEVRLPRVPGQARPHTRGVTALEDAWEAARLGEPWALRVVWETLAPQVAGYLRGRGALEPDDLTSEVFLALFPRLSGVTGGVAGLRTLTFAIAHARLVDDLRRQSRRQPTVELEPHHDTRTAPSAEQEALAALGVDGVRRTLSSLPDDQRDVLLMRLVGDLSVEQVAAAMGRSQGSVKQLQRRGLLALKAQLADRGVTP